VTTARLLFLAAIAFALLALALRLSQHGARLALVADPVRTPGVVNPDVTQANIGSTICVRGWTRTVRPPTEYTNPLKLRQMREYGVRGPPSEFQEDHLISLELGGHPTDPRNLWPEPYPRAGEMDQIENELNAKVCSGGLSLRDAQVRESTLKHTAG
jgi:hypothetical protein